MLTNLAIPASAKSVDWIQTYNNFGHTGENSHESILSVANVATLKPKWGRSSTSDVRAFIVNDHAVIARVSGENPENLDLWYLNYATGETLWKIYTGPDVPGANGTLATGNGLIFSECGLFDKLHYKYSGICAYGKQHGKTAWQFSSPCNCTPEANVTTPLLYAHGIVFFGYFMGGSGGKEYAIAANAETGAIYGAYSTGGMGSLGSAPFVQGKDQIYFGCESSVCALTHRNGSLAWKSSVGAPVAALTAGKDDRVYVSLCNGSAGLVALDDAAGAPLWSYGAAQCNQSPAALSANRAYFTAADGKVHALDTATGSELWSTARGTASSPSLANGVMYVDGDEGAPAASAYDAATGTLLWSNAPHASQYHASPVIIDGMLFVANQACGALCAYGLPENRRLRK
jgi:outer membrane protein assembly factor BamB